jgi:Domain of unknown function (DUF4037)
MSERSFVPARELCGAFYAEAVRPLLAARPHSAALLGWGSDVLGYDTARSTDHGWGPRLLVIVERADVETVSGLLDDQLPELFRGWPVRYGWDNVPASHHVTVTTLSRWSLDQLGVDATVGMSNVDWLLTPQQRLLGVVAGAVYADDSGALSELRTSLSWYPEQVWRWLLACQWRRLAQEEAFVARTAEVGDGLGSAITAARLVRDVMRLAMLLERTYTPYQKWLGTAFSRLSHTDGLPGFLTEVLNASDIRSREDALAGVYAVLGDRHNHTGLTERVAPDVGDYFQRPARVLMADRFTDACLATVSDPALRRLPLFGAIDQAVDSTDVLQTPENCRLLSNLYARDVPLSRREAEGP